MYSEQELETILDDCIDVDDQNFELLKFFNKSRRRLEVDSVEV